MLTKYYGAALVPLLAVSGVLQKRKPGFWLAGLLIPLAVLGGYEWLTQWLYGHSLFSGAMHYTTAAQHKQGFSKFARGFFALAFTGGGLAGISFCAPFLWRTRALGLVAAATLVAGIGLSCTGVLQHKFGALADPQNRAFVAGQMMFWAFGGVLVLSLAAKEIVATPRDPAVWLLVFWIGGTFVFAAFWNWTVNGRSLLPLLPALGILLVRSWEKLGEKRPGALRICLGCGALLALSVAWADFRLAVAVRRSAQEVIAKYGPSGRTVWFEGHWGFQYYMEQLGAKPVDFNTFTPASGDLLVLPVHNTYVTAPVPDIVSGHETLSVPDPSWLGTWCPDVGAGFYSSVTGPLPFGFGNVPGENIVIYELKAPDPK